MVIQIVIDWQKKLDRLSRLIVVFFILHMFEELLHIVVGKPILTQANHLELVCQVSCCDSLTEMIFSVAGGVNQVSDLSAHFGIITDLGFSRAPLVVKSTWKPAHSLRNI